MNGGASGQLRPRRSAGGGGGDRVPGGHGLSHVPSRPRSVTTPRPADLSLEAPPPTGHPVPKPHPHSGQLGALVQIPQVVPFSGEGGQDAAEGAVHCEGRGRPSDPPPHPLRPPPSSTHSPFWARAQKLRCRWA